MCLQGHLCPDSINGQLQVDSPIVERVSTMLFLHTVVSYGWLDNWYIGDISNAFLQGAPLTGKEMYMRQPKQGLKGMVPGQILRLIKSVYGRPDAPRAWYNELSRILEAEMPFVRSQVDPAMFFLRDSRQRLTGVLVIHVDDLMICHDGSEHSKHAVESLRMRFPFGAWERVADKKEGVTYCGKEIKIVGEASERKVTLSQNGFIDGRLQPIQVDAQRREYVDDRVTPDERTDYRSVVGSLQWLATQSRPDVAFEVNQLQKRVGDLRVGDLLRANRCVREVCKHRQSLEFQNLGTEVEVVAFHDAGLYNSVGVEIEDRDPDHVLMKGTEKKLAYSQKGALIGLIQRGATDCEGKRVPMNIMDWKSSTNRRVVESSFAAETHGALLAHGLAHFCQVLLAEMKHGGDVIRAVSDEDWQGLVPLNMVTDCKSLYDTVHKEGQHVTDKSGIVPAVLLRQMLSTRSHPSKARLLWVPTRCQVADGLTLG